MLDQLPEFVVVQVYGLFVGPLLAAMVAIATLRIPFCRPTWQPHRDGEYRLASATIDLIPVWLLGGTILAFAASQPTDVRPFLLLVGVPLFASPITAAMVSSRRVLLLMRALGLFRDGADEAAREESGATGTSTIPRSRPSIDVPPPNTFGESQPSPSETTYKLRG